MAMALNATVPYVNGKKEPKLMFALKIKNARDAVAFVNKIGSQDLSRTPYYRFDEKGQYLLISTDKKSFLKKAMPANMAPLTTGNKGEMSFEIGNMIRSFTRASKLNKAETKAFIDFFGKLSLINNNSEDGRYSSTMRMEMGDRSTNALANLVRMIIKINESKAQK
jgi:hypothetical protein